MTFRKPLTGSYKILNRSFLLERSNRIDDPRRVFYTALLLSENCEQYYDRVGNLIVEPITNHDKVNADMEIKYVLKRGWIALDINQQENYNFKVGETYSRSDIYRICDVPTDKQKGDWNTGYHKYLDDWFVFCNVDVAGRTGHDYQNHFDGDELVWFGRNGAHVGQPSIDSMLEPIGNIFVFYREDSREPFTFAGKAKGTLSPDQNEHTTPVKIVWSFEDSIEQRPEVSSGEVPDHEKYFEGSTKTISVNVYERNPLARKKCIDHHGLSCAVCKFNFENKWGEIGRGFIHVHHLKQLADIGEEYELDAVKDLLPVCPNCHSMLHRRRPPYSIEELVNLMKS